VVRFVNLTYTPGHGKMISEISTYLGGAPCGGLSWPWRY
jgi:hypothetical protein